MGSQGGGGGGGPPLSRQGSLYSLTFDEVQTQLGGLGKPIGSMNLDELLKSVWSAEANKGPLGFDSDSLGGSIQSQGSFTLSRDLSKKTVDEVWRDIQEGKNENNNKNKKKKDKEKEKEGSEFENDNHETRNHNHQERHPTLGEMTLEDFLVKAGIVVESTTNAVEPGSVSGQAKQWMHSYQLPSVQSQQPHHHNSQNAMTVFMMPTTVQQGGQMGPTSILDVAYPDAQMTMSPSSLMGALSDTQTPGRKRVGDVVEKTVERRQKRMIKNRESAARSRARKQAYTHELENKVSRLEEENERLRRQREAEKILPCAPPPEPKTRLRRTSSAPV